MKKLLATSISLLAFAACSSSTTAGTTGSTGGSSGTTGGGGGGDAGYTTITFTTVDVHPAAKAALTAAGAPVPDITQTSPSGGPYKLIIQGVAIGAGNAIQLNQIQTFPITSASGPYAVSIYNTTLAQQAPLGVLAGISPSLPDGGAPPAATGSLPELPCSLVEAAGGISAALTAGATMGLTDYFMPTGSQVGGKANPPLSDVTNAAAYAIPMSYASMLNCAGQPAKTANDSDHGVAVVYVTSGNSAAGGSPAPGVTFTLQNTPSGTTEPSPTYYATNYTSNTGTATDTTGVATLVGIVNGTQPPTLKAADSASDAFFVPGIATSNGTFFNTFVYIP